MWDVRGAIYDFPVPSIVMNISAILYTAAVCSGEPSLSLPFHMNVAALGKVHALLGGARIRQTQRGRNVCLIQMD